jgi:hypothetical protein
MPYVTSNWATHWYFKWPLQHASQHLINLLSPFIYFCCEIDSLLRVSLRIGESPGVGSKDGKRRLGMGKGCNISLSDLLGSDLSSGVVVKCIDDLSWDLFRGVSFEGIVGNKLFNEVGYIDQLVSFPDGVTCVKASVVRCGVRLKSVSSWDWVFVT